MIKTLLFATCTILVATSNMTEREIDDPLSQAAAHPDRPAADKARDADRKPARVLDFFGIKPGMHVADIMAGDGYFTEILARAVGNGVKLPSRA